MNKYTLVVFIFVTDSKEALEWPLSFYQPPAQANVAGTTITTAGDENRRYLSGAETGSFQRGDRYTLIKTDRMICLAILKYGLTWILVLFWLRPMP